jgi:hypothetical protein
MSVTVRSGACTSPGWRVDGEARVPLANRGPFAATSRSRSLAPASERLATTRSAPAGAASMTSWILRSTSLTCAARPALGAGSPLATSWGSRTEPTSTSVTGHAARADVSVSGANAAYRGMAPLRNAAPTPAPGPTAWTHTPWEARCSPSRPGTESNFLAAAART